MIHDIDEVMAGDRFAERFERRCYFGSSSKQTQNSQQQQNSVSSNTINPDQLAQFNQNLSDTRARASTLTPYTGQLVAGFNPTQTQAQGIFGNIANDNSGQLALNGGINAIQNLISRPLNGTITPTAVTPTAVNAGMLANTDLSPYLNPFTNDVINNTISQNERARQMAGVANNAAATAAKAFGGSRQGVADALTNEAYDRNNLSTIAGLNSDNYTQAVQGALGDINRKLTTDTFNSGQDLNAQQFNSGQKFNAQQNTFNNNLAANQFTVNAAGQLIPLTQAALQDQTTRAGLLSAVGDTQQQQQQRELDAAYQAWASGQQLTLQQQALINQALSMIPIEQTQTGNSNGTSNSTTTTQTNPGVGGVLAGLGSLAMAAGTGGASLGLTGLGGLGMGASILGQMTGSNAAGYGGMFGAAAPQVGLTAMTMPTLSQLSLPSIRSFG